MSGDHLILVIVMVVVLLLMVVANTAGHMFNLNSIKSKTVGDGQHGTSRWAANKEIKQMYRFVRFTPGKWRKQAAEKMQPTVQKGTSLVLKLRNLIRQKKGKPQIVIPEEPLPQGIVVGCTPKNEESVDTREVHARMLGAAREKKTD